MSDIQRHRHLNASCSKRFSTYSPGSSPYCYLQEPVITELPGLLQCSWVFQMTTVPCSGSAFRRFVDCFLLPSHLRRYYENSSADHTHRLAKGYIMNDATGKPFLRDPARGMGVTVFRTQGRSPDAPLMLVAERKKCLFRFLSLAHQQLITSVQAAVSLCNTRQFSSCKKAFETQKY